MVLNDITKKLIADFEGLRLAPYQDVTGTWTIGYGNTFYQDGTKVKATDRPLTKLEAYDLYSAVVEAFSRKVAQNIKPSLNANQFGALVSLAYNIGVGAFLSSTLLKKVNANPNDPSIKEEFEKWRFSKGRVIQGLVNRRAKEYSLYSMPTELSLFSSQTIKNILNWIKTNPYFMGVTVFFYSVLSFIII